MFKKSYQGGGQFGKGRYKGRNDGGDRGAGMEMHSAICAECGQACEVPFKPMGTRPVFCRDCFKKDQGESRPSGGGFGGREDSRSGGFGGRSFEDKPSFDAECATCGDDCTVPFKPKPGRDIYCRNCMGKKDNPRGDRSSSREERSFSREDRGVVLSLEQFEMLNSKMDKILKIVQGSKSYTIGKEESDGKQAVASEEQPAKATKVKKAKAKRKKVP